MERWTPNLGRVATCTDRVKGLIEKFTEGFSCDVLFLKNPKSKMLDCDRTVYWVSGCLLSSLFFAVCLKYFTIKN